VGWLHGSQMGSTPSPSSTGISAPSWTKSCCSPKLGSKKPNVSQHCNPIGVLRDPLIHTNDLPTLIRKCFAAGINLRELFQREDVTQQGLLSRDRVFQLLEGLPLGYSPEDIYEIFRDTTIFDAYGNADYTLILQHHVYTLLEAAQTERPPGQPLSSGADSPRLPHSKPYAGTSPRCLMESRAGGQRG
jgi:hypothetical protein